MIQKILLVAVGGGVGSGLRYMVSLMAGKYWPGIFPYGTFLVNISGCLLMGILLGIFARDQTIGAEWKLLLATGLCGGYTTFSAFAAENVGLIQTGQWGTALLYTGLSLLLGILAVFLGLYLAR